MGKLFRFDPDFDASGAFLDETDGGPNPNYAQTRLCQTGGLHLRRERASQKSRGSLVARFIALDPDARDAFDERAAILEYEAGLSREDAERQAFRAVINSFKPPQGS